MPAVDTFPTTASGKDSSAEHAFAVTPSDSTDLAFVTRGLYVGVGGDVRVTMMSGDGATFVGLAGGMVHPLRVSRVFATNTTATSIVGLY
jgi:hypothetical protein